MRGKATRSPTSSRGKPPADFVARAIEYAQEALNRKNSSRHGVLMRLAAKRFLADLEHAKTKRARFRFDPEWANRACSFIELLPHVEGKWETPNIRLHPAHLFFVVQLFGFRNMDGGRRFTTALFAIARKNAKSTLAAAIMLTVYCLEDEEGPQLVTAATTGAQARIVWNIAKRMVEKTSALREAFGMEVWANAISREEVGGTCKPINAKASTQDGLNPSFAGLDELHAHKTQDLLTVLKSAAGARRDPLFLYTTTEGYESPGPWPEERRFAEQVLQGVIQADHYLALIFALDEKDDDFDATKWPKANPLIDVNPILGKEIAKEAIEAKSMPGRLGEFRIKRLNRRASAAHAWVDITRWLKCGGPVDLELLRTVPCYAGLDLASTGDMTALRLVWRLAGKWLTWGRYWVPQRAVAQRTERGTVPYASWVAAGLVLQTDGDVTDYSVIERELEELRDQFNVLGWAYDSWNAADLVNRLVEKNFPMLLFPQQPKLYHPAMQELERAYISGALAHGGDPVLSWNMSNMVARRDANNNMAPDRKRSGDKIDGGCALLMGIGAALGQPTPERSFWDSAE